MLDISKKEDKIKELTNALQNQENCITEFKIKEIDIESYEKEIANLKEELANLMQEQTGNDLFVSFYIHLLNV